MPEVTVELSEEMLIALEARAGRDHDGDTDAAAEELLGEWLDGR